MRSKELTALLCAGLIGLVLGIWADRRLWTVRHGKATAAAGQTNRSAAKPVSSPGKAAAAAGAPEQPMRTFAEITPAIRDALTNRIFSKRETALRRIADTVEQEDIPAAMALAETIPNGALRETFCAALLSHWAELDPPAAMAYAQKLPSPSQRQEGASTILSSWVEKDLPAATTWVQALPAGPMRNEAWTTIVSSVAKEDPQRALELISNLPPGSAAREDATRDTLQAWAVSDSPGMTAWASQLPAGKLRDAAFVQLARLFASDDPRRALQLLQNASSAAPDVYREIFQEWTGNDPAAAIAAASGLPDALRETALDEAAMQWASHDAAGAIAWATNLPPGNLRDWALDTALRYQALDDPRAAVRLLASLELDPSNRTRLMSTIAGTWARKDFPAALEWVKTLPADVAQPAMQNVVWQLANTDPQKAAELVLSASPEDRGGALVNYIAETWEQHDHDAALAWIRGLPEGKARDVALSALTHQWAKSNPQAAADFIQSLPGGQLQRSLLRNAAQQWASENPQAALAWTMALPPGEARNGSVASVTEAWARNEPERAAKFVSDLPAGDLQAQALGNVAGEWAKNDPRAAANWVMSFADNSHRNDALQSVMEAWADYDPATAGAWLQNLPSSSTRDHATAAFAEKISERDPAAAATWAAGIANQELRLEQLENAGREWLKSDPAAARSWIERSALPAETKKDLLEPADRDPNVNL